MVLIKKMLLFVLLIAGSGSILGMQPIANPMDEFNELMNDLYTIIEQNITDEELKEKAEDSLNVILELWAPKLELAVEIEGIKANLLAFVKQRLQNKELINRFANILNKELNPLSVRSSINLKIMQGLHKDLANNERWDLAELVKNRVNKSEKKPIGTQYNQ